MPIATRTIFVCRGNLKKAWALSGAVFVSLALLSGETIAEQSPDIDRAIAASMSLVEFRDDGPSEALESQIRDATGWEIEALEIGGWETEFDFPVRILGVAFAPSQFGLSFAPIDPETTDDLWRSVALTCIVGLPSDKPMIYDRLRRDRDQLGLSDVGLQRARYLLNTSHSPNGDWEHSFENMLRDLASPAAACAFGFTLDNYDRTVSVAAEQAQDVQSFSATLFANLFDHVLARAPEDADASHLSQISSLSERFKAEANSVNDIWSFAALYDQDEALFDHFTDTYWARYSRINYGGCSPEALAKDEIYCTALIAFSLSPPVELTPIVDWLNTNGPD